jgi:hypothetical protein
VLNKSPVVRPQAVARVDAKPPVEVGFCRTQLGSWQS